MIEREEGAPDPAPREPGASTPPDRRIIGLDVARALAIAGMAWVHFIQVLSARLTEAAGPIRGLEVLDGRPAAIFMILAGIGISLRRRRLEASDAPAGEESDWREARLRASLLRRGVFFTIFGTLNLVIWPGDILRVYGIGFLVAAVFVTASRRVVGGGVLGFLFLFLALFVSFDFETNWNFETLEYANLWTPHGALMHLFYNGLRAVFPWCGLLLLGMLVGRLDLEVRRTRGKLVVGGLGIWLAAEALSIGLSRLARSRFPGEDPELIQALLGTGSLPPLPLFLLSATGLAFVMIGLCVDLGESRWGRGLARALAPAGQLAFTWYLAHILIVLLAGAWYDFREDVPLGVSHGLAALFTIGMFVSSAVFRRFFRRGPLESLLRSVAP